MSCLPATVAVLVIVLTAAAADGATLREPAKAWVLDYGDTACTAMHLYGSDKSSFTLAFRPSPHGDVVRFILARSGATAPYHLRVTAGIDGRSLEMAALRFSPSGQRDDIIWINFHRADLEGLRRAGAITLRGGPLDDSFPLPNIGAVLDGLDKCNEDLRRYWHADSAGEAALSRPAKPVRPLASYVSDSDYPTQAISAGISGRTQVMLMIDETGKPKDCLVEETSGIAMLDAQTCAIFMERARFVPALDAAGKPTRSVLSEHIRWVMGDPAPGDASRVP